MFDRLSCPRRRSGLFGNVHTASPQRPTEPGCEWAQGRLSKQTGKVSGEFYWLSLRNCRLVATGTMTLISGALAAIFAVIESRRQLRLEDAVRISPAISGCFRLLSCAIDSISNNGNGSVGLLFGPFETLRPVRLRELWWHRSGAALSVAIPYDVIILERLLLHR